MKLSLRLFRMNGQVLWTCFGLIETMVTCTSGAELIFPVLVSLQTVIELAKVHSVSMKAVIRGVYASTLLRCVTTIYWIL